MASRTEGLDAVNLGRGRTPRLYELIRVSLLIRKMERILVPARGGIYFSRIERLDANDVEAG